MSRFLTLLFILGVLALDAACGANQTKSKCEEESNALAECMKQASPILIQATDIPSSPEEVNISCRAFRTGMNCFDVFSKSCLGATSRRIMDDQTVGARNMFKFLCDDPAFTKKYLKHIPCYKAISKDWDQCSHRFTELISEEMNRTRNNSSDHSRQVELCCSKYAFVRCVYVHALSQCRKEDASFMEQIAETLSSNRAHTPLCRHFETHLCSSSAPSHHAVAAALLASVLLLVLAS